MPRLTAVSPEEATGPLKDIYDTLVAKQGKVVNIFQGMGNSPAGLQAYLSMSAALAGGELEPQDREAIYLAVSEGNGCHYCVSAHTMVGRKAGLSREATVAARQFHSDDANRNALLTFVRKVIDTKGFIEDADLAAVREAGYSDGQLVEAIGYIGLATFSNLFNHVNDTTLDFPAAPELE